MFILCSIRGRDMNSKPKVLLACATSGTIKTKMAFSLIGLLNNPTYDSEVVFQDGVYLHENMNNLVFIARKRQCSHILFVEHDMVFEPLALEKLLEVNKEVVGALYNYKWLPPTPMVFQTNAKGEQEMMQYKNMPKEPFKCYGVPNGLTLIQLPVFEKVKFPWFFFEYKENGLMEASQDMYFAKKCDQVGVETWCDPRIEIKHLGEYAY